MFAQAARVTPAAARCTARRADRWFAGTVDTLSNLGVLGLAAWTVLYHVGILLGLPTNPLIGVWLVAIFAFVMTRIATDMPEPVGAETSSARRETRRRSPSSRWGCYWQGAPA